VEAAGIEPASEPTKAKKIPTLRFSNGGAEEVRSATPRWEKGGGAVGGDLVQATANATAIGPENWVGLTVAPAVITISGLSGNQTIEVDFTSSSTAIGQNSIGENGAVLFGLQTVNGAPTYGGSPAVDGPGDGNFVDITTTVTSVPPPPKVPSLSTWGAFGLAALVGALGLRSVRRSGCGQGIQAGFSLNVRV
jgi:MYXO-CTERM domain-containing protein